MLLYASIFINIIFVVGVLAVIYRRGGLTYLKNRFSNPKPFVSTEHPFYLSRKRYYETLPVSDGAIVFAGDSLAFFGAWEEHFRHKILNRGIVGETVGGVRARLPEISRHAPAAVVLWVGINDFIAGKKPDEVLTTYCELLEQFKTKVVVINCAPINETLWNQQLNANIADFNALLAKRIPDGAGFLDAHSLLFKDGQLSPEFTSDGIHLHSDVYHLLAKKLHPLIFEAV